MKKKYLFTVIFLLTLIPNLFSFNYKAYRPTTLKNVILSFSDMMQEAFKKDKISFDQVSLVPRPGIPYRMTVTYSDIKWTGRNERVVLWCKAYNLNHSKMFNYSVKVEEEGKSYWMPIQDVLVPHLTKEIARGGKMFIYVIFTGYIEKEYLFLINEFKKI